ncbi:C40 family peptidase [Desulfopila aestuarii]|uniref:Cell wall-associated hydrolase, NlpC family n=1 Tax=Desulfopila aestuarii DSM 18488 TaxID=1121416 RepID=A0A1M7YH79_9BACT|nr:C40 family peptidase [Desulfopila aestuarii]SHO51946.1 Cell wall-associated hydrolase, NlpC family [Desulfopila aestuarii DSM 18488]
MPRPIHLRNIFKTSIAILLSSALITISCATAFATERQYGSPRTSFGFTDKQFEKKVKEYLDVPYKTGGTTKNGMDCSGFSKTVYSKLFGINLPHSSVDQFRLSALRKIDANQLKPGDLIFFANKKKRKVNHVGVYLSDKKFIHASSSQGITVSSLDNDYWRNRFVGSKRHVAFIVPKKPQVVRIKSEQKKMYH